MIESTVMDKLNSEIARLVGIIDMLRHNLDESLATIYHKENENKALTAQVLALQSKLDEIERQEPLHWVSLSKNFEVWQEVKKDDLYNSTLWTKPIPVYEPIRDLCKR